MQEIEELDKKKVKTVGISFGHQAIAQALGGHVARNPKVPLLLLSNLHNCTISDSLAVSEESKVKAICVETSVDLVAVFFFLYLSYINNEGFTFFDTNSI